MNLHTPERQPNESQADYRARQAASRAVGRMRGPSKLNTAKRFRREAIKFAGGIRQFKRARLGHGGV